MERDIVNDPYRPDEQRVVDYIIEQADGAIGAGPDPIGFLIAAHSWVAAENHVMRKEPPVTEPMKLAGARMIGATMGWDNNSERAAAVFAAMLRAHADPTDLPPEPKAKKEPAPQS